MGNNRAPVAGALPAGVAQASGTALDLRRYYELLRGWLWLFIVVALLAGGAAYLYTTKVVKPMYQAQATLEVDVAQVGSATGPTSVGDSQLFAPTEAQLLDSYPVASIAYHNLHLRAPLTPTDLQRMSTASAVPSSQLITLSASSRSPVFAARVANAMAYAAQRVEQAHEMGRFRTALDGIRAQLTNYRSDIARLRGEQGKGVNTNGQIVADQAAVTTLLQQLTNLQGMESQSATTLDVRIPAQAPASPVSPRPTLDALLAAVLALLAALGLVLLRDYMSAEVRTPEEMSALLNGAPVLGLLGKYPRTVVASGLAVADQPHTAISESFRMARTNLLYANVDRPPHIVLVTSAVEGEGKTTVAVNLAASLAELGSRVLLVDADLRRPSATKLLGMDRQPGLTSRLVSEGSTVGAGIHASRVAGLSMMPSGPMPPNPATLLSSQRMRSLLLDLGGQFDVVVVDSPPVLPVPDAVVLSTLADTVLLVADAGGATRQSTVRVRDALHQVGSEVSGIVLNKVRGRHGAGYYYGGYYPARGQSEEPATSLRALEPAVRSGGEDR